MASTMAGSPSCPHQGRSGRDAGPASVGDARTGFGELDKTKDLFRDTLAMAPPAAAAVEPEEPLVWRSQSPFCVQNLDNDLLFQPPALASCPLQGRKEADSRESKGSPEAKGPGRRNWKQKPKYLEAIFASRRHHSFSVASKLSPAMLPPPREMPSASAIATRLATHWIVDALAGDESIEFSVLQALLGASSEALAGAPEATRERLALRSLQEVSSLIPAEGDAAATAGVLRVDGARSCEDVLSQLIREVEISGKLEKDLLPPFSQDIQEIIRAKKFTLPETSFQLLKGVDPWITSITPTSQLEHSGIEQCANDQTLCSNHERVNIEKPVFPIEKPVFPTDTDNAEVQQDTMTNLANESETGNLQKDLSAPTCVLHQPCMPESRPYVPLQEDTTDAVGLGTRSPERSRIVEGNMSVGSVLASAGCDAPLQGSCNGANQGSKSKTNLQQGAATEHRMAFEEQIAEKSPLEVSGANKVNQALHDDGSMMKNNTVHGGLTVQTTPVSQNCNDNCHTSVPSSSKHRDRERAKKTSNEERSEDTSPEISVCSKDQDIDDTLEGLSQQDLCIKCGKDGELLTCSDCSLAAHDSCFGSSVTFQGTDLFYCPLCFFKKAKEAYLEAKKTYFEAKENVAAYLGTAQVSKQHDEQLNGVQPGAANRDGHSNGCDTSKRNNIHQNEAHDLARRDEEPHQSRKKHKINARGNGYPEEVLAENVPSQNPGPASMNKHSVLQNNSKTRVEDPEKKQQVRDKEARKEAGDDNSSSDKRRASSQRCDPSSNQDGEADQEDSLAASNQTGDSDEIEATSSNDPGKQSSPPWRNMRHGKKRLHEKESAVPSISGKGTAKQGRHVPQKRYSNRVASTGRRNRLAWTEAEEACLRDAMAKFTPLVGEQIPWTRILEYGSHVFHKTRLPSDLRTKWRNMQNKTDAGNLAEH